MSLTGNKGDWSEIYTFFKLLGDKKLYSGDENLNRVQELLYNIIKILRKEEQGSFEYIVKDDNIVIVGGEVKLEINSEIFEKISSDLFKRITDADGVFPLPDIEDFMSSIYCYSLKAGGKAKSDIHIVIHDLRTSLEHLLGFSIKSTLGEPSTLFNSNLSSNFTYRINNIDQRIADEINKEKLFFKKFKKLEEYGGEVVFSNIPSPVMLNNFLYVDYILPEIFSQIVFLYYSTKFSKISDIVDIISKSNKLKFNYNYEQDFYEHKVKRFLIESALGLSAATPWKGKHDATGGYIVVKKDGDLICYHFYNRNLLENYLFKSTKLDTPSTKRHKFGNIYIEKGEFYIQLNLQIRF